MESDEFFGPQYFGALGTLSALWRRSLEGGSYLVRVSLTQTARQLRSFGTYRNPRDIESLMRGFPPVEFGNPASLHYGTGLILNFYLKLREKYPVWFDRGNGWWNTFKDCVWGGELSNLRPALELSVTPSKTRISPRPAGYDPDARWDETTDVLREGEGHVYRVIPKKGEAKL